MRYEDAATCAEVINIGFDIAYTAFMPTPMVIMLSVHPSRVADLVAPENITADPPRRSTFYHDSFGNFCGRLVLPPGQTTLSNHATVRDSGAARRGHAGCAADPDRASAGRGAVVSAWPAAIARPTAWSTSPGRCSAHVAPGWARVQAIVDYVHDHIRFGYEHAAPTKTALGRARRARRRLPRLRASGGHASAAA